ncbi:MAG TPA: endo alpha-1,4 polygalactosaminidase [Jatrophihabitantaceae bacterium]
MATRTGPAPAGWLYQLSGYPGGRLDALARASGSTAVIDLARDGGSDYFSQAEVSALRASGKHVLAYFTIGSIENYRPEYSKVAALKLNRWADWPDEYFVRYWDDAWWRLVVQPRLDQALAAGFDGAYLDVPNAYEEIDLALVPGETREDLGAKMAKLIMRISAYAKARRPGFEIVPQNSPELQQVPGYTAAIDGIGVEELFYLATDEPCTQDFCQENLDSVRALRRAGKFVLAVDYATRPEDIARACARYRAEGFTGYVTTVALDHIRPPCD